MCGILLSTLNIPITAHKKIDKRGPDETNKLSFNGINFIHFLLHLTGERTQQPVINNQIVCIFNGEIYNYKEILKDAKSDIYSIIEAYKKKGEEFIKDLDGEYTIVLFDFDLNRLYISADIFKTKPLFYHVSKDNITIGSYESSCVIIKKQEYKQINPNKLLIFDLEDRVLIKEKTIYDFDLKQHVNNYDSYIESFEKAVLKRYPEKSIPLISLSSGLDSGAIACCLNKYNKDALYVTIPKNEKRYILDNRKKILGDKYYFIDLSKNDKNKYKKELNKICEPFIWDWRYHINLTHINNGFDMGSMLGKSKIINFSKQYDSNIRVMYSGIGADEVMARNQYYSCGWGNVDKFPDDLNKVYPWANFFNGSMENYLKGDEYVGGSYGYETRYPFCDKDLVQQFLWLKPELKNIYKGSIYKPALMYYLDKNKFPYADKKLGFNV